MTDRDPAASTSTPNRSRLVLTIYLVVFAISAAGMTIFGFKVVADVKARAQESDAALRMVAWQILAYADREGVFPTSEATFGAEDVIPDRLEGVLGAPVEAAWPVDWSTAASEDGVEVQAAEAEEIVQVSWPPTADLPPVLGVGGRPSGLVPGGTTLDLVNGWLRAARDQLGRTP
ncbi:MAG: hypothetical protein GY895_16040 [Phycisphaera sp.]|nr:hypothetical protein [Phycisphaera sp.]